MPRRSTPTTAAPRDFAASDVQRLRKRLGLSQAGLAAALNISVELVQAWEADRRVPRGAALRLLELVNANPELITQAEGAAATSATGRSKSPRQAPLTRRAAAPRAATPRAARERQSPDAPASPVRAPAAGRRASDRLPSAATLPPTHAMPTRTSSTGALAGELLKGLVAQGVAFVAVGGVAAQLRGAPGRTDDLDIVYDRSPANLDRLATFLKGIHTTLRGAPGTIPFAADPRTLAHTAVLALDTKLGPLDLRQRIAGIGDFTASLANSTTVAFGGRQIPTLTLDAIIVSKRATGRSRDREELRALEALR